MIDDENIHSREVRATARSPKVFIHGLNLALADSNRSGSCLSPFSFLLVSCSLFLVRRTDAKDASAALALALGHEG